MDEITACSQPNKLQFILRCGRTLWLDWDCLRYAVARVRGVLPADNALTHPSHNQHRLIAITPAQFAFDVVLVWERVTRRDLQDPLP